MGIATCSFAFDRQACRGKVKQTEGEPNMTAYLKSNWRKSVIISIALLVALAASVGALRAADSSEPAAEDLAPAPVEESPSLSAQAMLEAADALWRKGNLVDSVLAYLVVLDTHPDSPVSALAEERLRSLADEAEASSEGTDGAELPSGGISAEDLAQIDSKLPSFDALKSARAKQMISYFCQVKGDCLAEVGMMDEARACWQQCIDAVFATMYAHPDAALNIEGPKLAFRVAKAAGPETVDSTVKGLESLVAGTKPSLATWIAHYFLADHYLHAGQDRGTAEIHLAAVLDGAKAGLTDAAVASPWAQQKGKSVFQWAVGWAEFELGHYETAIARFQQLVDDRNKELLVGPDPQLASDRKSVEKYANWAAFTISTAMHRLNPDDDDAAIAVYQEFLDNNPENECADFARIELGRLHTGKGQLADAEAVYKAVGDLHPEAKSMAQDGMSKVASLRAEALQQ
jgi:tetratricopeptide (TPR) repeat protein